MNLLPGTNMLRRMLLLSGVVLAAAPAVAQTPAQRRAEFYRAQRVPFEPGFRVFIVPDMEGMGSVVDIHEIIAGNEGERYKTLTGPDYWGRFRSLLTQEVNATIRGARAAGARSFTVRRSGVLTDLEFYEVRYSGRPATLVRGFPKPLVMITGLDSTFGTLMFTGAHANAGSPGVMPHNFAFDSFTVNGRRLNEVGINALMAGEMGVSVSLVAGDDVLLAETREILGYDFVQVLTKRAVGRSAAITYSPARVRQMLAAGAAEAVRREQRGEFPPFTLARPYTVEFKLRQSFPDTVVTQVAAFTDWKLEKIGERTFRLVTSDARQMGYLLDAIEEVVLR